MKIYNSLNRKIEEFVPLNPKKVGLYTCGPTVYSYAHIGNMRTYLAGDLIVRALKFLGYEIDYIMNLTDVGHLTGDNLGDADTGKDRMEESARKEGKSAWDIAKFYTDAFLKDFDEMNLARPRLFAKATDHIVEQIALVKKLEEKGFTYKISDGIYFDTSKFPEYGKLSTLAEIKEGARVEVNPEKKNARDFALWKFSYLRGGGGIRRQMEWDSPWGVGFPGWHIECSAMAMKYLGESFDIHVGGEDLRSTHHPNEIAQSEAATGKQFVKYWVHGAFILIEGKRMSKSGGNYYKLQDLVEKGYDPMDLRYLYLTVHYRDQVNMTLESLGAARNARLKLVGMVVGWKETSEKRSDISSEKLEMVDEFNRKFREAVEDDLNMPQAIAVVWEMAKSKISDREKLDLIMGWDAVLGLGLELGTDEIPKEVVALIDKRNRERENKNWARADEVRGEIEMLGYEVSDKSNGKTGVKKKVL